MTISFQLTLTFQDEYGKDQFVFHIGDKTSDTFTYTCVWSAYEDGVWSTDRYHGVAYKY